MGPEIQFPPGEAAPEWYYLCDDNGRRPAGVFQRSPGADEGGLPEDSPGRTAGRQVRAIKVKLHFDELLCSAQMGRVIRMELLATSG